SSPPPKARQPSSPRYPRFRMSNDVTTNANDDANDPTAAILDKEGVIRLSTVEPKEVDWLWPGRIPRAMLPLLADNPENGKSYVTLDLAARGSTGRDWPDGATGSAAADVLILQAEDDPAVTLRPRLDQLGAHAERVFTLHADRSGLALSLHADIARLDRILSAVGTPRLLIIDPLTSYLGRIDYTQDPEVRRVIEPLKPLAEKHNVAAVAVMHLNKDEQKKLMYRIGGSIGFIGVARAAILVAKDPKDESRRLFLAHKLNIAPKPTGLAFRIGTTGIEWEGQPVTATAQEVLGPDAVSGKTVRQEDRAVDLLSELLEDGPVAQEAIKERAKSEGISHTTLYRARARLGVVSKEVLGSYGEHVLVWARPDGATGAPQPQSRSQVGLGLGPSQSQTPL